MKTIKGGVRCEYWNRAEPLEFTVPADATVEEIEEAGREAAIAAAGFEWWLEDDHDATPAEGGAA